MSKCQKCGNTGMADSGGTQPWGEPISVPCDCKGIDSVSEWLDSLEKYNQPGRSGDGEEDGNIQKWEVLELVRMARKLKELEK